MAIVGTILTLLLIGIFVLIADAVWVIYRLVIGAVKLNDNCRSPRASSAWRPDARTAEAAPAVSRPESAGAGPRNRWPRR